MAKRGWIKIVATRKELGGRVKENIRAEDVKVVQQLQKTTQQTLNGGQSTILVEPGTEANANPTTTASREVSFKTSILPQNFSSRSSFVKERQDYFFGFLAEEVTVTSDMFATIDRAQVTSVEYDIPAGEENGYYTVTITEVTEDDASASVGSVAANGAP